MLHITVPARELWDSVNRKFVYTQEQTLSMEHSLVSIAKWESKWNKPFITKTAKTHDEIIDYIKCMTLTPNVSPETFLCLTSDNIEQIKKYIDASMTATRFSKQQPGRSSGEQVTAELIYWWMITLNIPPEYDQWHINRLITLLRVCSIKNAPSKKLSLNERYSRNAALNAERRRLLNSKG